MKTLFTISSAEKSTIIENLKIEIESTEKEITKPMELTHGVTASELDEIRNTVNDNVEYYGNLLKLALMMNEDKFIFEVSDSMMDTFIKFLSKKINTDAKFMDLYKLNT